MTITKLDSSKVKEWMQDTWKLKYPCVLQGRGLTTSLNQIKLKCTVPEDTMNEQPAPAEPVALVEPVEAPTSDEKEILLETARAAQVAGTFPSDSAIRLLTDDYGWNESERRHCMAAARLALAYWGHAWGCLTTNHPALAPPAKGQAEDLAVLRQQAVPVPVSERPWKNEAGWLDPDGECWWCPPDGPAYWSMANPAMVYGGWLLPAHAIPVPPENRHHD